jgi:hypothetical protein
MDWSSKEFFSVTAGVLLLRENDGMLEVLGTIPK